MPVQPSPADDGPSRAGFVLGPATRLLWRGPDSVELGLGPSGVILDGVTPAAVRSLAHSAGTSAETDTGAPDPEHQQAFTALARAGYLWPRHAPDQGPAGFPADDARRAVPAARLAPELRALQVRHGQSAARILAARRYAAVEVEGTGRAAVQVAALLAAAGVGRVRCSGGGRVRLGQTGAGGLLPGDEGAPFAVAAEAAVLRAAPGTDVTPFAPDERPDLTVLALDAPLPDDRRGALHAADAPHLCVSAGLDRGVVGPLVVPGLTSCVRCADLTRRDHDPAWDALAVQLTTPGRYGPASSAALAVLVAGVAVQQALAFLDGDEPAAVDGTLELAEPDWRLRRRSWPVHPRCGCIGAADADGDDPT